MPKVFATPTRVKYPQRPSRSDWMRRESKAARFYRTRGWRPRIDAAVAEARAAHQQPLLVSLRSRWDAPAELAPRPMEPHEPPPRRIPLDGQGRAIAAGAIDAFLEAMEHAE